MIIDCHGHYTVLPKAHDDWREAQKAAFKAGEAPPPYPDISDGEIRETIEANQLRLLRERGADMTIFSPRASTMAPHVGDQSVAVPWARACNDLIARVVGLYPETFAGVCMLPQSPEADMSSSIAELRRCVDRGFIGCNLNPDPGGGHFRHPPLTDRFWYPFYEAMVDLNVPAMIHVSGSCNRAMHATGAYYIAADTIAFMQLLEGDLFADFPSLRFIIPHGGGAVPYHWGRYRGLADMLKKPALDGHLMNNVFFDTCVYHQPGINLLADVIENKNILFGSEMVGAVRGIDPTTGHYFDDTKRYVDALDISDAERHAIFEGNARRVFPRLDAQLKGARAVKPSFVMDADWLCPHPSPKVPDFGLPHGAVDAHCHVFGPGDAFPFAPERKYTPCDAGKGALFALRDRLGFARNIVVQATCHGADNRAMVDALVHSDGKARGVATVRPDVSEAELAAMHEAGVRGVRFNFVKRLVDPKPDAYYRGIIEKIAALGWHIVVYFEAADLEERWDFFTSLPTVVVVDHMGRPDVSKSPEGREFSRFLEFMERDKVWAKVTCPERLSKSGPPGYPDFIPFARTVVEAFPDRVLWGTDWPHPNLNMVGHMPDDGALVDLVPQFAQTAELRKKLLVDNPMRLYWSDET